MVMQSSESTQMSNISFDDTILPFLIKYKQNPYLCIKRFGNNNRRRDLLLKYIFLCIALFSL